MDQTPRRRKGNRRKLHISLKRKNGKEPLPEIAAPTIGPGAQVQFRVSVDGPRVIISMNLPVLTMVTTPENVRQFAAALVAAAEKAEGNKGESNED